MQRYYQRFYRRPDAPRDGEGGHDRHGNVVSENITAVPTMEQNQSQNQAHDPARPQGRGQEQEQLPRQGGEHNTSEEVPSGSNRQGPARRMAIVERAVLVVYGFENHGLRELFTKVENPDAGGPQTDFFARVPNQWNMWVGKCSRECGAMYNVVKARDPKAEGAYYIMLQEDQGECDIQVCVVMWTNPREEPGTTTYPSPRPPIEAGKAEMIRFWKFMVRLAGGLWCVMELDRPRQ